MFNNMFGAGSGTTNGKGKTDDLPFDPWMETIIPNQQAEVQARQAASTGKQVQGQGQAKPPVQQQVSANRVPQQAVPNPPAPNPSSGAAPVQNELMVKVLRLIAEISAVEKGGALAMYYFESVVTGRCRLCFPELFRANAKEAMKHSRSADRLLVMFGGRRYVSPMPDVRELSQLPMDIEEIMLWVIGHKYKLSVMYTNLLNLVSGQNAVLEDWARAQIQLESDDCLEWRMMAEQVQ